MSDQSSDPVDKPDMPREQAVSRMMKRLIDATASDELKGIEAGELGDEARRVASQLTDDNVSPRVLTGLVRLMDFVLLTALGFVIYLIYVRPLEQLDGTNLSSIDIRYALIAGCGGILAVIFIQAADGYGIITLRQMSRQLGRFLAAWTFVFLVFAITAFFFKQSESLSRVWFGAWFLSGAVALTLTRIVISHYIRKLFQDGRLQRRAILVGGGERAAELIRSLESQPDQDLQICGIFDDRDDDRSPSV
jgi:FlaA1/EpsC-like NDP-sugar epimerase